MLVPTLSEPQIAGIAQQVAEYIDRQRRTYRSRAVPLNAGKKEIVHPFFDDGNESGIRRSGRSFCRANISCSQLTVESLRDIPSVAANVQFMFSVGPGPLPYLVEHFRVQRSEIRFIQRICGIPCAAAERSFVGLQNIERLVLVEFANGADFWNQLFGFFRANGSIPIRVFVIEDEAHFLL